MESIMFRIMNLNELHKLQEEIENISDSAERDARTALIDGITEKVTEYDVHIRNYEYKKAIKAVFGRGIAVQKIDREQITAKWDAAIDSLVPPARKQAEKYYTDQFRWHIFSFELLGCASGEEAKKAFDSADKSELYLFFDYADEAYKVDNAYLLTSSDIDAVWENSPLDYSDIYLFNPKEKWTYIKPHEEDCGPYFFAMK